MYVRACDWIFLCRYNKNEGMLKELQAAHISLTQQAEGLRKSNEGLTLQQERLDVVKANLSCKRSFKFPCFFVVCKYDYSCKRCMLWIDFNDVHLSQNSISCYR